MGALQIGHFKASPCDQDARSPTNIGVGVDEHVVAFEKSGSIDLLAW